MCGICGFTGKEEPSVIHSMTESLFHRGPDENGIYENDQVSLGMRRLAILDLATGHQPIHNEDRTIWTVFNGEIYNFSELRKELRDTGHAFYTSHSDTELIVHLYEQYGLDFPNRINGMFAIALWDSRLRRLVLVRDRMGVKPLFYAVADSRIVFGSEIKAILQHPAIRPEPDCPALRHYFAFKCIPSPMTAFAGVQSLRPAELLAWTADGGLSHHTYWRIPCGDAVSDSEETIQGTVRDLIEDSTRLRMNCDVPFGAYLSGGVDSSAVVAFMSRYAQQPVVTFSLGYTDQLENKLADIHYARRVSRFFGTTHHEYIMTHEELLDDLDAVTHSFDQPFSGTISTYFLSKLIARHVKVALSGDGSDELFGSYLTHRLAQPMHYFAQQKKAGGKEPLDPLRLKPFEDKLDFLEKLYALSKGDPIAWRYSLMVFSDEEKGLLFSDAFKNQAQGTSSLDLLRSYFQGLPEDDPLNQMLFAEWTFQLPDQALAFVDFLSMAHSVEVRSPFLDYRLIEYLARVPGSMKIRDGVTKSLLKQALRGVIPQEVIERPKEGFVQPSNNWLPLYEQDIRDRLSPDHLKSHGFFNVDYVQTILDKHFVQGQDQSAKIWNLLNFQIWHNRYF